MAVHRATPASGHDSGHAREIGELTAARVRRPAESGSTRPHREAREPIDGRMHAGRRGRRRNAGKYSSTHTNIVLIKRPYWRITGVLQPNSGVAPCKCDTSVRCRAMTNPDDTRGRHGPVVGWPPRRTWRRSRLVSLCVDLVHRRRAVPEAVDRHSHPLQQRQVQVGQVGRLGELDRPPALDRVAAAVGEQRRQVVESISRS